MSIFSVISYVMPCAFGLCMITSAKAIRELAVMTGRYETVFLVLSVAWAFLNTSSFAADIQFGSILVQCTVFIQAMIDILFLGVLLKLLFSSSCFKHSE